jgi:putative sigma-54 modulation protein
LHKHKSKLQSHGRGGRSDTDASGETETPSTEGIEAAPDDELARVNIVRTKSHVLKPMSPEEAVLQMEMVGHDFFVFFDAQTESVAVVYRRHDGDYGLIEPAIG